LYDVINNSKGIPNWVLQRLKEGHKEAGIVSRFADKIGNAKPVLTEELQAITQDMPKYALNCKYELVSDCDNLDMVRATLVAKLEGLKQNEKLFLGVDTEWGKSSAMPSLVQLAVQEHAWLIDTAKPSENTRTFFRWLFQHERVSFLGFAFLADARKLAVLMQEDSQSNDTQHVEVIDIQKIAVSLQAAKKKGQLPGLKAVAAEWLGVYLDKTEQCSDWDRRPLSESQMHYAAADAAVMLDIVAAMGIDPSQELPRTLKTIN